MKKISIVTTTIHPLNFLEEYIENFLKIDADVENIKFIIVGDNKTPPSSHENYLCDIIQKNSRYVNNKRYKKQGNNGFLYSFSKIFFLTGPWTSLLIGNPLESEPPVILNS